MRTRRVAVASTAWLLTAAAAWADPDTITITPLFPNGVWTGGPYTVSNTTGLLFDEPDCDAVPNSCDDLLLTINLPAGYTALNPDHVVTVTVGWTPTTPEQDVDVYFQDPGTGLSVLDPAATSGNPEIAFIPIQDGVTTVRVRCVMFSAVNLVFSGAVSLGAPAGDQPGVGIYEQSPDVWSCDTHLAGLSELGGKPPTIFDHSDDAEPALRFDDHGRAYIGAIAGLGAGSGLWRTQDQCAQTFEFVGAVDAGAGGGDTDVETATSPNLLGFYNVYLSSLTLANISMAMSCDGGNTFLVTPVSTPSSPVDRQWNAAHGSNIVYLSYRQGATQPGNLLEVVRLTYPDCSAQPVTIGPIVVWDLILNDPTFPKQLGNMATDRREHPDNLLLLAGPDGEGAVYHGYTQENLVTGRSEVWVANSQTFGLTWTNARVWEGPAGATYDHVFSWVSVDRDGNVWTAFSDDTNVYYSVSSDRGATWTRAVRVNAGVGSRTAIFPHVIGGAGGRALFSFYGHAGTGGSQASDAAWRVFVSRTEDGFAETPIFREAIVSDRDFHQGPVCQDGLDCSCCRELLECYEIDINPVDGRAMVVYGSQAGGSYITNQLTGASAYDGAPLADLSASCPNPAGGCEGVVECATEPCECPGCLVNVDADDADVPPVPEPGLNIREVHVAEPHVDSDDPVGGDVIIFSLRVEDLDPSALPPNAIWQVIFNTPGGQHFVRIVNCAVGGDAGDYGHFETATVVDGALPHWEFRDDGTICIWISRSLVGNPQAGDVITGITGHTRVIIGNCPGSPAVFPAIDSTNSAQYDVVGNEHPPCTPCPWDCQTGQGGPDGDVGFNDLLSLLAQWSESNTSCDLGVGQPGVGFDELLHLLANWGPCP